MLYILIFLWIVAWGVAGYFTVKAIKAHNEKKRAEEALADLALSSILNRQSEKVSRNSSDIVYNPFEGIL